MAKTIKHEGTFIHLYEDNKFIKSCPTWYAYSFDVTGMADLFPEEDGIAVSYNSGLYHCMFCINDVFKTFIVNDKKVKLFIPSLVWMISIDEKNKTQEFRWFLCDKYPFESFSMTYFIPLPGSSSMLTHFSPYDNKSVSDNWRDVCKDYIEFMKSDIYSGFYGEETLQFTQWKDISKHKNHKIYEVMPDIFKPYQTLEEILPKNEYIVESHEVFNRLVDIIMAYEKNKE